MSVLAKVKTIDDYARLYLARFEQPICHAGGTCHTRLELVIKSPTEKFVVCPRCRELGVFPSGVLSRLVDFPNKSSKFEGGD